MARPAQKRSWLRWVLTASAAVAVGGVAQAQGPGAAPPSAPLSGPATPPGPQVAPDNVPDTPQARAIIKRIKQAERAGYERHDLKRYLAAFDSAAVVTIGRLSEPEGYDRVYDLARWSLLKRLETAGAAHKQDLMYFRSADLKVEGETARLEIDMRIDFFGGHRVNRVRYDVALKANRVPPKNATPGKGIGERPEDWRIVGIRFWPLAEQVGVEPLRFDATYWKGKDDEVAKAPEGGDALQTMVRYLFAWRFAEAEATLVALVTSKPERADAWLALTRVRLELGDIEGAKTALTEALSRDPNITVPELLVSYFPKARHP